MTFEVGLVLCCQGRAFGWQWGRWQIQSIVRSKCRDVGHFLSMRDRNAIVTACNASKPVHGKEDRRTRWNRHFQLFIVLCRQPLDDTFTRATVCWRFLELVMKESVPSWIGIQEFLGLAPVLREPLLWTSFLARAFDRLNYRCRRARFKL